MDGNVCAGCRTVILWHFLGRNVDNGSGGFIVNFGEWFSRLQSMRVED